jgi:tetratricopeptide (TPR) repeat protein
VADAYLGLGRTTDAIACYQQSLSVFRELGDQYNQAEILTHLATARQVDGNTRAARDCLRKALAILTELNQQQLVGRAVRRPPGRRVSRVHDLDGRRPGLHRL